MITHGEREGQLIVWAALSFNVSIVATQYATLLQEAAQHVLGAPVQLEFKVMP